MTAQPVNFSAFIDAARDSVAREIATLRREAERERDLRQAEHRARMAELDARIMSVSEVERQLGERLSTLKDGEPGRDADPALITRMVTEAVMALPPAENGKDADLDAVASLVRQQVENAVAALPIPKEGATLEELSLVDARVQEFASIFSGSIDEIRASIPSNMEFVPPDVAESMAAAIRLMAETPQTQSRSEINVFSNVTMPEIRGPEVNVTVPQQLPPVVNMEAPVVNVGQPTVIVEAKRTKEVTKVTGWDENGRITSFEKTEED